MDQQNTNPETPRRDWEWLSDLIHRAFWPMDGFLKVLLAEHGIEIPPEHHDLLAVLVPLVENLKSDLLVINEVLEKSFGGPIGVKTTVYLQEFKRLDLKDFREAFVSQPRLRPPVALAICPSEDRE